jgi:UDP-N-acetylglucosamine--N-acetylmuramyl-(pentapeptide) pyrophosphoryl-undecaprenol N-acetylglucosamine transferase
MHTVVFTGGGTGGHIYPGLAVADELKIQAEKNADVIRIVWLGSSSGMDRNILGQNTLSGTHTTIDGFYGIPSGRFRRYFSLKNLTDIFRIFGGFVVSFFILFKYKPDLLFSKGGFVSVPPCLAARLLRIPVYTHECDFTPGLATRINSRSARHILVSYKETAAFFSASCAEKIIVTGNPVRSVFYNADAEAGLRFLGLEKSALIKPVLLVLGGSSGAKQINDLIRQNIDWLCAHFIVIHQTGMNADIRQDGQINYKPYPFIYAEMPHVMAAADIVLSRAGANSLWECAVLAKPLVLIPLCGSGTRGDQIDNARFFAERHAASVLTGDEATSGNLRKRLEIFEDSENRRQYAAACKKLTEGRQPAAFIAELLYKDLAGDRI